MRVAARIARRRRPPVVTVILELLATPVLRVLYAMRSALLCGVETP
jgi:hypothetical protein